MLGKLTLGFLLFAAALFLLYAWNRFVQEGFANALTTALNVPPAAFVPAAPPVGMDAVLPSSPAPAMNVSAELLLSDRVPVLEAAERRPMTSEQCLAADAGEPLKQTRNYAQRTNNYIHSHPDDCSAPYKELIGTFYKPAAGVGAGAGAGAV